MRNHWMWKTGEDQLVDDLWQETDFRYQRVFFWPSLESPLAKILQSPTNQPTGHQMSRQSLFVPKNAYFAAKMAVFGPIILIILGGSKSSGTHISENHLGAVLALFVSRAWHHMAQKYIFWVLIGRFCAKYPNFYWRKKTFGTTNRKIT